MEAANFERKLRGFEDHPTFRAVNLISSGGVPIEFSDSELGNSYFSVQIEHTGHLGVTC